MSRRDIVYKIFFFTACAVWAKIFLIIQENGHDTKMLEFISKNFEIMVDNSHD